MIASLPTFSCYLAHWLCVIKISISNRSRNLMLSCSIQKSLKKKCLEGAIIVNILGSYSRLLIQCCVRYFSSLDQQLWPNHFRKSHLETNSASRVSCYETKVIDGSYKHWRTNRAFACWFRCCSCLISCVNLQVSHWKRLIQLITMR